MPVFTSFHTGLVNARSCVDSNQLCPVTNQNTDFETMQNHMHYYDTTFIYIFQFIYINFMK